MQTQGKSAIVVGGGAMRGIFATGVLDSFLEHDYAPFDFAMGVSAGSVNLVGYLAGDHGHSYHVLTTHACQPEFINVKRYIRGGHLMDIRWLWQRYSASTGLNIPRFEHRNIPLLVVTTDIHSGQAHYHRVTRANMDILCPASCAIPLIFREYPEFMGVAMADGGIADAIPVLEAYRRGATDITVVLSRPLTYREPENPSPWLVRKVFRDYPQLAEAILHSAVRHNTALAFIEQPPADCRVRVVAPPCDFGVGSFTRDLDKLNAGYQLGKRTGKALCLPSGSTPAPVCMAA